MLSPGLLRALMILKQPTDEVSDLPGGGWNQSAADKTASLTDVTDDLPGGGWDQKKADAAPHGPQTTGSQVSSLDNIISQLLQPHKSGPYMQAYQQHLASVPTMDDRSPIAKILTVIAGGIGGLTNPRGSADEALKAYNMPYARKVQQYQLQGQGLGDLAGIEEKTSTGEDKNRIAAATLGLTEESRKTAQQRADEQIKRDAAAEEAKNRGLDISERTATATERRARAAEMSAEAAMKRAEKAGSGHQVYKESFDPETGQPVYEVLPDPNTLKPGQTFGGKMTSGNQEIVSSAQSVKLGTQKLRDALKANPGILDKIGPISGNVESFVQRIGASEDPKMREFATGLRMLEAAHAKIYGRSSIQMIRAMENLFQGINQGPEQLSGTLNAMDSQADDFMHARGVGKKTKTRTLKDGTVIHEEE